ncbi:hypothetical protein H4V96_001938 [Janthinobacterium sp. CG_23.4]|nr:hypothetical protein [Janthinobacterium sp. CG_23.4]
MLRARLALRVMGAIGQGDVAQRLLCQVGLAIALAVSA